MAILNILLQHPEEMDLHHKPSAIRENKIFTLDMHKVPIKSAEADDNGAFHSKGSAKRYFTYSRDGSKMAHKSENGSWYINVKDGKVYRRHYVNESEVNSLRLLINHGFVSFDFH